MESIFDMRSIGWNFFLMNVDFSDVYLVSLKSDMVLKPNRRFDRFRDGLKEYPHFSVETLG